MGWVRVILLVLQGLDKLVTLLRERELIDAGKSKVIAEAWEKSNERVQTALTARRSALDSDPDPHDPYARD